MLPFSVQSWKLLYDWRELAGAWELPKTKKKKLRKIQNVHKNKIKSYWLIPKVVIKKQETYCSSGNMFSTTLLSADFYYLHQGGYVFHAVCLSKQDCAKPTHPISMKLSERVWHGPRKNPLHFRVDQSRGADPQI